jgi:hypothetical protein
MAVTTRMARRSVIDAYHVEITQGDAKPEAKK